MGMGITAGTLYNLAFTHQQAVYILGLFASVLYVLDQIRVAYPGFAKNFQWLLKFILRAEEQLKESSAIPYAMALLLTILSFPKVIAVASIYVLGIADPMSALFGIRFGKHKIIKGKSLEGSLAFFISTFFIILFVFLSYGYTNRLTWILAIMGASICTLFEMIPLKLDDNLTIPLFTATCLWFLCSSLNLPV